MKWSSHTKARTVNIIDGLLKEGATWKQIASHFNHHNPSTLFLWYRRNEPKYGNNGSPQSNSFDTGIKEELQKLEQMIKNNAARIHTLMMTPPPVSPPPPPPPSSSSVSSNSTEDSYMPEGYKRTELNLNPHKVDPEVAAALMAELKAIGTDLKSVLKRVEGEIRRSGTSEDVERKADG